MVGTSRHTRGENARFGLIGVGRGRFRRFHGHVKVSGVDDAVSLELDPDAVHAGTRKHDAELHRGAAAGDNIRGIAPGATIFLIPGRRTTR